VNKLIKDNKLSKVNLLICLFSYKDE